MEGAHAAHPPNGLTTDDEWLELVDATVERAWDRWCYAQQHAVRARAIASSAAASRWRWRGSPGRTTGSWSRRPARIRSRLRRSVFDDLLQKVAQLGLRDGPRRGSHPLGEQPEELAEARVVQVRRGLDHLGRRALVARFDAPRRAASRSLVAAVPSRPSVGGRQLESEAMQPVVIGDVIWEPSDEVIAKSRLKRFMDRHDIATFSRAPAARRRGHRVVLGRRDQRHRHRVLSPLRPGGRPVEGQAVGDVVARRAHEHRAQLPRPPSRRRVPRQDGAHLGGRAGRRRAR